MLWCYYAVILCIRFYICPDIPVEIIFCFSLRSSSRNSQSQQNLTKNITHFTIQFLSKNLTRFMNLRLLEVESNMLPQRIQKLSDLTNVLAKKFLFGVSKKIFALHHILTPKNCILEEPWKQTSVYFYISP